MSGSMFIESLYNKVMAREKTQTRRLIMPQPKSGEENAALFIFGHDAEGLVKSKPKYKVGEVIYLKEPYLDDLVMDRIFYKYNPSDIEDLKHYANMREEMNSAGFWKNKMFMPEEAARHFIKVTGVKAERIADISMDDAIAEGIDGMDMATGGDDYQDYWRDYSKPNKPELWPWFTGDQIASFRSLWNSINAKFTKDPKTGIYYRYPFDGQSADITIDGKRYITIANPWVFAYTFELVQKP